MKRRIIINARTKASTSSCKDLVVIDSDQLKAEEQKNCRKIYKKLENARRAIAIFETESVSEFRRWLHSRFGAELTELREFHQKADRLQNLIDAIESEIILEGYSPWEAYDRVMNPQDYSEDLKAEEEEKKEEAWESEEAFERFKERLRAEQEENHGFNHHFNHQAIPPAHPEENEDHTRLRDRYRILARKLHPDLNPGLDSKKIDLWHQVQQAYEERDLERMEALAALCDIFDEHWDKGCGVSTLRNLFQELKEALRQMESKVRKARKDPAWKFHEKMKNPWELAQIENGLKADISYQKNSVSRSLREMQSLLDEWAKPPRKVRRKLGSQLDLFSV